MEWNEEIIMETFKGVWVHRYRDQVPELRIDSILHMENIMTSDPELFVKDQYLKYLGWMCNDTTASVRKTALRALTTVVEAQPSESLSAFITRFLSRFLEMCRDVDHNVIVSAIQLLCSLDQKGFLADMDTEELRAVEALAFHATNLSIRKAAAQFVCLQYEAFGKLDPTEQTNRQTEMFVQQAIALVEFVEDQVEMDEEGETLAWQQVDDVVQAFSTLDDCRT